MSRARAHGYVLIMNTVQGTARLTCTCAAQWRLFVNTRLVQVQWLSSQQAPPKRPGFFTRLMENIRKGMERDKAMKESLQKLQEETAKVEQSDSFQAVRSGFQTAKSQASAVAARGTLAMKDKYEALSTSVAEMYDRLSQTSVVKDAKKVTEDVAKDVAETMSQQGEQIGKTEAFQKIKAGLQDVKEELFDQAAARSQPYQPPSELKTRSGMSAANMQKDEKRIQADDDTTGVVLHKDSKWYAQWKAFKDDNPVVNRLFDLKMKYDESDNIMIRTSRFVTDRIIQAIGGVFSPSETAQTFAEIAKIDSSFDKENFIKICESLIIPTVLEAFLKGDLDILRDWCHDAAYGVLSALIEQDRSKGLSTESRILDLRHVDVLLAKMMEPGPVLVVSFQAQQHILVRDSQRQIIDGGEDHIENIHYIWALCRDQSIYEPTAAWRILEFGISSSDAWV